MDLAKNSIYLVGTQGRKPVKKRKARKPKGKRCTLYGLAGPDGIIRYIGQTTIDPHKRLGWHKGDMRRVNSPVYVWMRETPDVQIIVLNDNATWHVSEILEIAARRAKGEPLLNVTRGGPDTLDDCQREQCVDPCRQDAKRTLARKRVEAAIADGRLPPDTIAA